MCRWIVDADQIQLDDFENDILYHNKIVDSYLNNDRILGIEAPKGLGKTFLIKCKRMKSQDKGVKCLPIDSMCDILDKITLELLNRINTNSIFLSSTCFDLNDYRKMIFKELRNHDYSVIMSERNDFGTPESDVHSHDYCLDIVKKCKK